jgi:hypothetical protein
VHLLYKVCIIFHKLSFLINTLFLHSRHTLNAGRAKPFPEAPKLFTLAVFPEAPKLSTLPVFPEAPKLSTLAVFPEAPKLFTLAVFPEAPKLSTLAVFPEAPKLFTLAVFHLVAVRKTESSTALSEGQQTLQDLSPLSFSCLSKRRTRRLTS